MKRTTYALLLVLTITSVCQADHFTLMTEELRPIGFMQDGKLTGLAVEVVREILKIVQHPDNITVLPWARAYNYIQNRPKHILFAMGRSPVRENLFKWVGPIVSNKTYMYKKKGSDIHITTLDEAKNVGAIGVIVDDFNHTLLKSKGFTNLTTKTNYPSLFNMLAQGRLDLVPCGELNVNALINEANVKGEIESSNVLIFNSKLYIAFSKDFSDSTVNKWQQALDTLKKNGKNNKIIKRYTENQNRDNPNNHHKVSLK